METVDAHDDQAPRLDGAPLTWLAQRVAADDQDDGALQSIMKKWIDVANNTCPPTTIVEGSQFSTVTDVDSRIEHEIAHSLNIIGILAQACAAAVRERPINYDRLGKWAQRIALTSTWAAEISKRSQEMARGATRTPRRCDVAHICRQAKELIACYAQQADADVRLELKAKRHDVCAEHALLLQVLIDLLRNAIEACNAAKNEVRCIYIRTASDDEYLSVQVRDTGAGISDTVRSRLFEPFFTTKADGVGIGLAICRAVIAEHGGQMFAESRNGSGAVFTFTVPLAAEQPDRVGE